MGMPYSQNGVLRLYKLIYQIILHIFKGDKCKTKFYWVVEEYFAYIDTVVIVGVV